jgi:ACS family hexuronate transporter-like MFS transporter
VKLWIPALSMLLVSLISYIDRHTLALLAPTILKDTGLTAEQYGYIISAFSFAYMIGNPLWGRLLDRLGLRAGMFASVSFWTVASTAHSVASGFWSFAVARAALGLGEGATFPGGLRTSTQTLPPELRSRGIAVSYSGGSLGAMITPVIVTPIALGWGWRAAFLFTGFIGAAWLFLWAFVSRRPDVRTRPDVAAAAAVPIRWTDKRIWSYMSAYALCAMPLGFILYGSSLYLNRALGLSQAMIGWLLWIPPFGWEVGYFFWGWIMDRTLARSDAPIFVYRRMLGILTVLTVPLAATARLESVEAVMIELFFELFVTAGFVIVAVNYATWVYTTAHAGLIAGLGAGSWGAGVALLMPTFGRLFDQRRWEEAFLLATLVPLLGFALWWWANRD